MIQGDKFGWSLLFLILVSFHISAAETARVDSPDQNIRVTVTIGEKISYSISHKGKLILDESAIALQLSDGGTLGLNPMMESRKYTRVDEKVQGPSYRSNEIVNRYNELNLKFKGGFGIVFRVYDEGVAYRFYTAMEDELIIRNEIAEFRFDKDYRSYLAHTTNSKEPFAMAFQNIYSVKMLSEADSSLVFLPLTLDMEDGIKLTITESDLEAYPGMFIQVDQENKILKGVFASYPSEVDFHPWRHQEYVAGRSDFIAQTRGTRDFPWRVLAISESDAEMPENNMVFLLASPSRIGDDSWVKPGKSAWEWWNNWGLYGVDFEAGINMETYRYYIDFASQFGLEYIILDEGWYEPKSGDMMSVVSHLDLPKLVAYAESKGVGIVLWTVFNVLDEQLEEACAHYAAMGIKGFKVDFLDRDDQQAVEMTYRIAEETAKHHLFLDLHGFYKPTGIDRTYPHIINFEGLFGLEEAKWSTVEKDMPLYDVTFPFIRMMAGPADFTPGAMQNGVKADFTPVYSNPMSQGTRCHQLAAYVVYDSPFTMLCDSPTRYENEPKYTSFLASIPMKTDEVKILSGKLGEYIVTARRNGDVWHVGGMTNWSERELQVDFSFLNNEKYYNAILFRDGVNADKQGSDYRVDTVMVNIGTQLTIQMASGGGFVIRLEEYQPVTTVPDDLQLDSFYKKYLNADGIPVVSSAAVRDEALIRTGSVITAMLSKRPDVKQVMVEKGCKVMIIGEHEQVCDLPEYAHICDTPEKIEYWNKRARGFGGAPEDTYSASLGEENVLCLDGDRYHGESILVHEFAHLIHTIGIVGVNPDFYSELEEFRQQAIKKGIWENTYASSNKEEYFAETVQSFFNCNRFSQEPNGVHNEINNRERLKSYNPAIYHLLVEYFFETDLPLCEENYSNK